MSILNVDYENLGAVSNKVSLRAEDFSTLLGQIKEKNERLKAAWMGTDAESYTAKVEEQAVQMQKLVDAMYAISTFLNSAKDAYRKAQESNML